MIQLNKLPGQLEKKLPSELQVVREFYFSQKKEGDRINGERPDKRNTG